MDEETVQSSASARILVTEMSQLSTAAQHSRLRRYVPDRSMYSTLLPDSTDNDSKVFICKKVQTAQSIAPSLDRACEPNPVNSSLIHLPLRKCLHGTSLTNLNTAGVDILDYKDDPVHSSDKHFQINFDQTIKTKQRKNPTSHIISLRLRKPVLRVVKVQPEVVVLSKGALQIHKLLPAPILRTVMAVRIHDMDNDTSPSISDLQHKNTKLALGLDIATADLIAKDLTPDENSDDDVEWSLALDRQVDVADNIESPLSVLSPLSPFTDTEELIDSYARPESPRRASTTSDISIEDSPLPEVATKTISAEIIVNGKPHAHPLRSNPVTEADYIILLEEQPCKFPPRTDSLPFSTSTSSSRRSVSEAISPRTIRPQFPPRKDSLLSMNSFLSSERPRTSHVPNRPSRADTFNLAANRSELSLATSVQKAKLLHRRSASVADLFHSLTNKSANRSQSVVPQVSAPILVQAPIKPPTTAPLPRNVQVPVHPVAPYTMRPPFRSQTWNTSQISTQSSANMSTLSTDISPTHNASQTSLHSNNNTNRRAFVMQQRNTSVFSLHSQHSTQDLNGMLSGYDTHIGKDTNPRSRTNSIAPHVPPKHEEIERLDRRGSETVRIPAPVPVDLKKRRFQRVLNLRRANAAFTSALNTSKSNISSSSCSPNTLSPVNETFGASIGSGTRSRRGSIYAVLAPSLLQIDVANAADARRGSELRSGRRR